MDNNEPTINVKLTEEDLSLIRQVLKVILKRGTPICYLGNDELNIDIDDESIRCVLEKLEVYNTDVHTEHCYNKCGCKYHDSNCTVKLGIKKSNYPCEECSMQKEEYKGPEIVESIDYDEDGEP